MRTLELKHFLDAPGILIDVRSPQEFAHAHIPGAKNIPLFTDNERAVVGTAYKKQSRQTAVSLGVEFFAEKVEEMLKAGTAPQVRIHCWRGGMRSQAVALLFQAVGADACALRGGYKAFRRWTLDILNLRYNLRVLGGLTGSGKSEKLRQLQTQGEQVIDLETLASHRGSSFGALAGQAQPSNEQFEVLLACALAKLDAGAPIWIEDESRMIGHCALPKGFYEQIRTAPVTIVEAPFEERLARIEREYCQGDPEILVDGVRRISNRLGSERTLQAIEAIQNRNWRTFIELVLHYYDRSYLHSIRGRK